MIFNMKLANTKDIKKIDSLIESRYGISENVRVELAGFKSYEIIKNRYSPKKPLIVVGTGNNGADGLVAARFLALNGSDCRVVIVKTSKTHTKQFSSNLKIIKKLKIQHQNNFNKINLKTHDLIIDAIFGVGLNRDMNTSIKKIIKAMNLSKVKICSLDLPSGMNPDNGLPYSECIKADATITYDFIKPGLVTDPGCRMTKKLFHVSLSTPNNLSNGLDMFLVDNKFCNSLVKDRNMNSNKGTFGHVVIIGGSKNMSGAILLSGLASYKTGCGLVTLCAPRNISNVLKKKLPEAIIIDVPNSKDNTTMDEELFAKEIKTRLTKKPSVVVIGPGLGSRKGLLRIVEETIAYFKCPIIIDADALNLISNNLGLLSRCKSQVILTPHPGEMSRISKIKISEVQRNRLAIAKKISKKTKTITVLKGFRTVISESGKETFINKSGNPGMATGGMGDALTGIIASFIAQGYTAKESALLGVFTHGKAGDIIAEKTSKRGILASDIIKIISKTILSIEKNKESFLDTDEITYV